MGVLYRATDVKLGRAVAIKLLARHLVTDETAKARFVREARAASALDHPHIANIYEIGESDGELFIAMALYDGETLKQRLANGRLSVDEALDVLHQVLLGLEAAHGAGIVHRDIKPANILVTRKGSVKILDFGLAKLVSDSQAETMTQTGQAMGTVLYMSPEQLRGQAVDSRSDLWSFGVLAYELLAGTSPFQTDSSAATVARILNDEPPSLGSVPGVPDWLSGLVSQLLRKNRAERPQSASEVLRQVEDRTPTSQSLAKDAAQLTSNASKPPLRALGVAGAAIAFTMLLVGVIIALNVGGLRTRLLARGQGARIESLAVLPLKNFSADPEQEYFADGMTEALITNLAKIGALRVISVTSVMQYKGFKKPLPQIARELNVDAVVEGSVQRSGNRARITAQLIEAATDRHLWAESYEREIRDVLALQSELARAIASEIRIKVTPQERKLLASTRPVNPEAHEAYLKGLYYFNDARDQRRDESFQKSIQYYRQALQLDPDYALAHAQLARAYHWRSSYLARGGHAEESKASARRALELDDTLAEAHGALAFAMFWFDGEWVSAEREFKRATELNPGYGEAHAAYAMYLQTMGRLDEAIAETNKALLLDPLTLPQKLLSAGMFACAHQYERALEQVRTTLALNPNSDWAQFSLGRIYVLMGRHAEGIAEFQKLIESTKGSVDARTSLAWAYALSGQRDQAAKMLAGLSDVSEGRPLSVPPDQMLCAPAAIYAALGERTKAIASLEKGYAQARSPAEFGFAFAIRCEEALQSLRSDNHVQEMFRRLRLPQ